MGVLFSWLIHWIWSKVLPMEKPLCVPSVSGILHSIIHPLIQSFTHWFMHSIIQSLNHSIIQLFNHSTIQSYHHSIIQSFNHSIIHPFNHTIIQSYNHSIIQTEMPLFTISNDTHGTMMPGKGKRRAMNHNAHGILMYVYNCLPVIGEIVCDYLANSC